MEAKTRSDLLVAENDSLKAELTATDRLDSALLRISLDRVQKEKDELAARLAVPEAQIEAVKSAAIERFRTEQARVEAEFSALKSRFASAVAEARLRETETLAEEAALRRETEKLREDLSVSLNRTEGLEEELRAAEEKATGRLQLAHAVDKLTRAIEKSRSLETVEECARLYAEVTALAAAKKPPKQSGPTPTPASLAPRPAPAWLKPTSSVPVLPLVEDYGAFFARVSAESEPPSPPSSALSASKPEVRNIFKRA